MSTTSFLLPEACSEHGVATPTSGDSEVNTGLNDTKRGFFTTTDFAFPRAILFLLFSFNFLIENLISTKLSSQCSQFWANKSKKWFYGTHLKPAVGRPWCQTNFVLLARSVHWGSSKCGASQRSLSQQDPLQSCHLGSVQVAPNPVHLFSKGEEKLTLLSLDRRGQVKADGPLTRS